FIHDNQAGAALVKRRANESEFKKDLTIQPAVFSGRVLDFNNNPLPGATLRLAGKSTSTVTDNEGYFRINYNAAPKKDSLLRVDVGLVGYEPSVLAFNALDPDAVNGKLIYLKQQSNSLDEVVVSGFGNKRMETRALVSSPTDEKIDSIWVSASPTSG